MITLRGTISFRDLETGVWVLVGDDGRTYPLAGGDRRIKKDGARVEIEGALDARAFTTAMMGPVLNVTRYRFL